ncbi:unnamed protein product [Lymnaea stagnalis]|uniref:HEAT repeat domain-containing protein n=1 Tax=Lymnaea stagnalis TaxID=6523 RepID=A0AAV2IA88_LYMST
MTFFDNELTLKPSQLGANDALRLCTDTTDIDIIIDLTRHSSPQVRQRALREMCPCRVQKDITAFWNRVFEMLQDTDENVRYQVLHTLCDGSPVHLENEIAEALDVFNRDPSPKIRRQAHRALASYMRTGKWNIL